MAGINRAAKNFRMFSESRKATGVKCVFLSHQQKDKDVCRKISDYLTAADIDVYFDEDDEDLKAYRQTNRPQGVVDSIKKGINYSSHMLVVVSPNTLYSSWVPWEVGYGYDNTHLGVLTLKGIKDESLPDYLKTTTIIRGTKSLNAYIASITGRIQSMMESIDLIKSHTMSSHPLDNYLDWNQ
ncbi:toll/interleukin-1 receptor domain-containing protein [Algoriphagus sp. AK58]|uniref:toll/interleukin-1 receptor domain-containing protein n=1 Tax=Algoriphagus sp. AK58 TaxID=1406877 RepID=UPI001C9CA836|nr:toll/interleukin-1 receptor domain-containing protein [Algoriphagus sp. AK58]